MILESDNGLKIVKPTANQIEEAVGELPHHKDSFIILSSASMEYVQVAADRNAKFTIEYQERGTTRHFRAKEKLAHGGVVALLICYNRGDAIWKATLSWQHVTWTAGRTYLMTVSLVLWVLGLIMMLPALAVREWWANLLVGFGTFILSLGCIANIISAFRHQRMWGRSSIVTPDCFGGIIMFRVLVFLYSVLAAIFALAGAKFAFQLI